MANELLDLTRIRRNWDRSAKNLPEPGEGRLAHVRPPLDPYVAAWPLLERMRIEIAQQFPAQRGLLAPFVARVETLFARMRDGATPGAASGAADAVDVVEGVELRQQFVSAINDLEDLCEALLGTKR